VRRLLAPTLTFALLALSGSAFAQAGVPNERLPPDWFKSADGTGWIFSPALERPCQSRSGFCPNYQSAENPNGKVPANWVMARYKSRHAGGFDPGTASLLMVYIPPGSPVNGQVDNVHRWLNFALPATQYRDTADVTPRVPIPATYTDGMPRTFTMVSVTEGTGSSQSTVHFQKFHRYGDNEVYTLEGESSVQTQCYGCHPNGLRAISPAGYHVNAAEAADPSQMLEENVWHDVQKINEAMNKVAHRKVFKWDQSFVPKTSYRYVVGPSSPANERTKEMILGADGRSGCAYARTSYNLTDIFGRAPGMGPSNRPTMQNGLPIDWEKVRDNMDCEQCHNHYSRGAITEGTGFDQISFKIMVDRSMPDGQLTSPYSNTEHRFEDALNINERIALNNCLREELERNYQ
jgi:hypothetical protein